MSHRRKKGLVSGRPGVSKTTKASLSAKAGRTIIRSHHQLTKALDAATKSGDAKLILEIQQQIEAQGGLSSYQHASLLGQSDERGGDTSKLLVDWLKPRFKGADGSIRVLEVGALSTSNACSKWDRMIVTRIDLNSQQRGILQQDFMERPQPTSDEDLFDVISLSLVLNYVPDKEGRGRMLSRTCLFLDQSRTGTLCPPCLFLVLPAPCVQNSRYMTHEHLARIMNALGYHALEVKTTNKLYYSLWEYNLDQKAPVAGFTKRTELNPGKARNNFSVIL
ncbi:25S rRNA adenine-N(1) methyltransferase [Sphaceloma murrayae]|uniref:25S rRNA adenine-N(1) methyltransferase n=1 Tax=Sphaceloma murrayae TaxID=2082308 RepID=A0A2K1QKH1_9PEZI|nr:25S rRNA adenine-N(1) methyltransferase [Sphaceloma murrayae]